MCRKYETQSDVTLGFMILRKQFIIKTGFDQLKNISYIEHFRCHNCICFMANLLAGFLSY
ncbi:hypothetical protein [Candidatus Enterovibrio escicola]|uniref:hypothetical protein n=1 Tax=Candidatus Enterovibrio escicola TaxID=1927127 RepID=UPI001237DF97|nr:hypothetical protein [Candidatus Enterovibrio escacola]